jgi:hypothetical protein
VVCVTPAGRRRYLEVLLPYMVSNHKLSVIDRWDLWVNTGDARDIAWMRQIEQDHPFIKMVYSNSPFNPQFPTGSIGRFFSNCHDDHTVYIRLDDDIVYLHPECLKELVRTRLENRVPFMVYANCINNSICTHIHQRLGALSLESGLTTYDCLCRTSWVSGEFAFLNHSEFLEHLRERDLNRYLFSQWLNWEPIRMSINCICWLGDDLKGTDIGPNEEEELSVTLPRKFNRPTMICGSALCSHYAYSPQRGFLDRTPLLSMYKQVSMQDGAWSPPPKSFDSTIYYV